MAQRILESSIASLEPDGAGGYIMTSNVYYVDTTRADGDQVHAGQVNVPVSTTDTIAAFEANRSAAYRADMTALWGSAPANAILLTLKIV